MTTKMMHVALAATVLAFAAACGGQKDPTKSAQTTLGSDRPASTAGKSAAANKSERGLSGPNASEADASAPMGPVPKTLAAKFDCIREAHALLVSAHRGGPRGDFPENAVETFQRTLDAATPLLETDVSQSKDGVLFMFHDDALDERSTGKGAVADTTWSEISKLKLKTYSATTAYSPPSLDSALDWAVKHNAVLELDRKRSTSLEAILAAVKKRQAKENVVLITYTVDQAAEAHKLDPTLMLSVSISSADQIDKLEKAGVKLDHVLAWTGDETPNPELWKALAAKGIESAFGTLGRRGKRLDDQYWKDGDGSEYVDLGRNGLQVVSTDLSDKVARQLRADKPALKRCGF